MGLFSLSGDVAFVTGAGSGIGRAIAIGLAEAGADVALFDLPQSEGLSETAAAVAARGRRALPLTGSVADLDALIDAVARCESELGGLSSAVNSAGFGEAIPAENMSLP